MTEETDTTTSPDEHTEVWTFGGSRVNDKQTRVHVWIDASGTALHFKSRGHHTVGCEYEVRVDRLEGGGVSLYEKPRRYIGPSQDTDLRDKLAAQHRAAETQLAVLQRERRAKDDDPFELAVNRLAYLVRLVPPNQRTTLVAYVVKRLLAGL